ncbi:hypothetical protein [Flavobacterium hiemivividum]|uniref:Uncharacterized protein n=1 Tax=Flavobacterium hiemivividum TaxID=2541734 RepID=A0A4R5D566_9FLAO|nr:hypothetical protein [Flavobacterium hiemivividum]TDE06354.1 hypothetical protein E0F98_01700 [Flavobacterium hiemivividum]
MSTNTTSERINFNYSDWERKIEINPDDTESIKKAGNYMIDLLIEAAKAEKNIAFEKRKENRLSIKNNKYYTYKKPEKADDEGYLSFIYEINQDTENKQYFYYDTVIDYRVANYIIQSKNIRSIKDKLHQGTKIKGWTPIEDLI